jgi:glycerophosphoryl diester phosphodiesterase
MNAEISTKPDGQTVTEDEAQSLNIFKMTYEEVKKYDVGRKLHPRFPQQQKMQVYKPLLQDVITNVEDYLSKTKTSQVYYNIETKCSREGDGLYHPTPQIFIDLLMRVLKKHNIENRAIIQSFDIRTLQYLHTIEPKIKTALLIDEASLIPFSEQLNRLGFIPSFYSPHYSLVTEGLITACRKKGMLVIPWTVNDPKKMKELKSMGVDGLISDYPNLFSQL